MKPIVALFGFCSAALSSSLARAEEPTVPYEGGPVPPGYHVEERVRRAPPITGAVLGGVGYGLSLAVALTVDASDPHAREMRYLALPVV